MESCPIILRAGDLAARCHAGVSGPPWALGAPPNGARAGTEGPPNGDLSITVSQKLIDGLSIPEYVWRVNAAPTAGWVGGARFAGHTCLIASRRSAGA